MAFEKADQAEEKMAEKDESALNKAAQIDEASAEALEAQATKMFADAKAIEQVADGNFKDEEKSAQKLRGSSTGDAASVERAADLERANRQADSYHLRQVAVHLEEVAIDKEKSAEEEKKDAAGVAAEWQQNHNVEAGDAKALRSYVEKSKSK